MKIIEDPDDMMGEMSLRFFISVMTYNGICKFSTYMWGNVKRRFEDFERKNARACKHNTVQCQCCGRHVGAITRIHLINNKVKPKDGFPGHQVLHNLIVERYGKNKFQLLDDGLSHEKCVKWQGNNYSKSQVKLMKGGLVDIYREKFPSYDVSKHNISLNDKDPNTDKEYGTLIADVSQKYMTIKGYYINSTGETIDLRSCNGDQQNNENNMFVVSNIDKKIIDLSKYYSEFFAKILHKKYKDDGNRQQFFNTKDEDGLKLFLGKVFQYMALGYKVDEIEKILKIDIKEIAFWIKKIKKSKKISKILNF
jgi:hypothetical protein